MRCPNCGSNSILKISIPFKGIRHQDFQIIDQSSNSVVLRQCDMCFHIFKKYDAKKIKSLKNYLKSKSYKKRMFSNRCSATNLKGYSREKGQALFLKKLLKNNKIAKGNFLDFGCNRGDLVGEVKKELGKEFIHFFGLDSEMPKDFKSTSNNSLFIKNLSEIPDQSVSIIVISHTLIYIENHLELLKNLKKKLNQDGIFLIQNPHPLRYSTYLLDDQFHFFQLSSLKYAFSKLNFKSYTPKYNNDDVELLVIGSPKKIKDFEMNEITEFIPIKIEKIKDNIKKTAEKVLQFSLSQDCYVLGTTAAGALTAQILKKKFKQAIDENWIEKTQFYNKDVSDNINKISNQSKLIIPIYLRSKKVANRVKTKNNTIDILSIDNI